MKSILLIIFATVPGVLLAQDSLNMRTVSIWPYGPSRALAIARVDGHKYVVLGSGGGIMMINVDDPKKPRKTGELATAGMVEGIKVLGNTAYIANGDRGLVIASLKNPRRPAVIGQVRTRDHARGIDVADGYAYIADRDSGICIIDVRDPARPAAVRTVDTPAKAAKVKLQGKYLVLVETPVWGHYVVGFVKTDGGIRVFDRSNPGQLKELKYYTAYIDDNDYSYLNVSLRSDTAYFQGGLGAIKRFPLDCTQESLSTVHGDYRSMGPGPGSGYTDLGGTIGLVFRTEEAYLVDIVGDSIRSQHPTVIDYSPRDALYDESLLYLVKKDLEIYDVKNHMELVGKYPLPGYSIKAVKSGDRLYLLHERGFVILDARDPFSPSVMSEVSCGDRNRSLAIAGAFAYIGGGRGGIELVDVKDARRPKRLGPIKGSHDCDEGLTIGGTTCYAVEYDTWRIDAFDISHAPDIRKIETAEPLKHSSGQVLCYSNGRLIMGLANIDSGDVIKVIDAGDRTKLKYVAGWGVADTSVTIHYVSDTTGPFNDVIGHARDLASAMDVIKNTKDTLSFEPYRKGINGIACMGDTIFVVSENSWCNDNIADKLRVFVYGPAGSLRMISGKGFPCWGTSIAVSGTKAYVADVDSGIRVLDISDVQCIKDIAHYIKERRFSSVCVDNGFIYATDYNGFRVLREKQINN